MDNLLVQFSVSTTQKLRCPKVFFCFFANVTTHNNQMLRVVFVVDHLGVFFSLHLAYGCWDGVISKGLVHNLAMTFLASTHRWSTVDGGVYISS